MDEPDSLDPRIEQQLHPFTALWDASVGPGLAAVDLALRVQAAVRAGRALPIAKEVMPRHGIKNVTPPDADRAED